MFCSNCKSDLLTHHILEDGIIPPMTNKSKIIYPKCSVCQNPIRLIDVSKNINENKKVLLIAGTVGAGKTAIGQYIENKYDYVFVDGNAIQKRENYFVKRDPNYKVDFYAETISTMLILLGLGYNVVVGYIIYGVTLKMFVDDLAKYRITPIFRVLVPERNICLERDIARECWTAGEEWVDKWYDEINETLEETVNNHFVKLLRFSKLT